MAERQLTYWAAENDKMGRFALAVAKRAEAQTYIWNHKKRQFLPPIRQTDVIFFGLPEITCWRASVRMVAYMHAPPEAWLKTPFLIGVNLKDSLKTAHAVLDAMRQMELFCAGERPYPVPMLRSSSDPQYNWWICRIEEAREEILQHTWGKTSAVSQMRRINAQIRIAEGGPTWHQSSSSNIKL